MYFILSAFISSPMSLLARTSD